MIAAAEPFSDFERYGLSLEIPSLNLPALPPDASEIDLWERADAISYGDDDALAPRDDENLMALLRILGVIPASDDEISSVIHFKKEL